MTTRRQGYSSTVVAPPQLAVAAGCAAAIWVLAAVTDLPWLLPALVTLVIGAVGAQASTVRVTAGGERLFLAQGPWPRTGRRIATRSVVTAEVTTTATWAQVFGVGVPLHARTTRLTIRPGPALHLVLDSGEDIRVSTADPAAALIALDAPADRTRGSR